MNNKKKLKQFLILNLIFWSFDCFPTSFNVTTNGQTLTLDGDYYLGANSSSFVGAYSSITIDNTTGTTRTATLDGAGHTIYFPYNTASSTFQFTGNGVVLTMQNVSFQGYNPAVVSYASANAKIIFGDNTKIVLDRDLSILYTDRTWTCSGNVVLDGQSLTLTASGESALSMQGLNKTLTINNTILRPQGPDSICCLDGTSKIVLSNSTLELGRDGMAVNNGYIDIDGKVLIRGVDTSYTGTPSLALLSKRYQNLGFVPLAASYAKSGLYSLNLADTIFTQVRISKENKAYYSVSSNPYSVAWTEIVPSAVYKSIDVGDDGQIWVVKTDQTVHRVTLGAPPTLTAATNVTGDYVAVGGANYVFVLNNSTGLVYQCNNPTGAANSWTAVSGLYFPRSIAAGNDGTLWFVALDSRVYKKPYQSDKIEQIFDGIDRDVVKISASGTADSNCIAVLTSMPKDGRVLISQSGGPFRDLGINKIVDLGVGINGSMVMAFDSSIVTADATFGLPIYSKINTSMPQILTMDRTLTFSSDKYLTIKSGAELELSNYSGIRYQPNDYGEILFSDFTKPNQRRRHFVFEDYNSTLSLNRSILDCGPLGLSLIKGRMLVEGLNWIISGVGSLSTCALEVSSDFDIKMNFLSNLNVSGPIIYSNKDNLLTNQYFQVAGVNEATVKSGVTDPTCLQAITDAYAAGFKAPGLVLSDWLTKFGTIGFVDQSITYAYSPMVAYAEPGQYSWYSGQCFTLDVSKSGSKKDLNYIEQSPTGDSKIFYINISHSGLLHLGWWTGISSSNQIKARIAGRSLNNLYYIAGRDTNNAIWIAGAKDAWPTVSYYGSDTNGNLFYGTDNHSSYNGGSVVPLSNTLSASAGISTLSSGASFGADYAENLFYVERTTNIFRKRTKTGVKTDVTLPGDISGTVSAVSVSSSPTQTYMAIASSSGQAFLCKNEGAWTNLGVSGVISVVVGNRGTVLIVTQRDPTLHVMYGSYQAYPFFIRPGV